VTELDFTGGADPAGSPVSTNTSASGLSTQVTGRFACREANSSLEPENRKAGILSNLQRICQGIAGNYAASN